MYHQKYINPCEDFVNKWDKPVKKIRAGKIAKVVLIETMTLDFQDLVFPSSFHDNSREIFATKCKSQVSLTPAIKGTVQRDGSGRK